MKAISSILFFSIWIIIFTCSKDKATDVDNPDGTTAEDSLVIGIWEYSLPPVIAPLTDTITFQLNIESNKNFIIEVTGENSNILFQSNGTWNTIGDSITLTGETCLMQDTLTNELVEMDTATCSMPITISLPESYDTWSIKSADFSVALSALPIPADLLTIVMNMFQIIPLSRKE